MGSSLLDCCKKTAIKDGCLNLQRPKAELVSVSLECEDAIEHLLTDTSIRNRHIERLGLFSVRCLLLGLISL